MIEFAVVETSPENCPICGCPYSIVEYGNYIRYVCGSEWSLQSNGMAHRSGHCAIIARLKAQRDEARKIREELESALVEYNRLIAERGRLLAENEALKARLEADRDYMLVLEVANDELRGGKNRVQ